MLKAFDFAGKELWTRDLQKDYGKFGIQFGYASSPLLHGDALYLQVLHGLHTDDPSYVLKIDKMTRQDRVAHRAADQRAARIAGFVHRRRRCCSTTARPRSSSPAAISSPATIPSPARSCGAPTSSTRRQPQLPDHLVADHRRRADHRADAGESARRAQAGRERRHLADARGVDVPSRSGRAIAGERGQIPLSRHRAGRRLLPGAADRKTGLRPERIPNDFYSSSPVLADGKIYVTGESTGVTTVLPRRTEVRDPRVEHVQRSVRPVLPGVGRRLAGAAVRQDGREPVGGRRAEEVTPRPGTGRADKLPPWNNRRSS